MGTSEAAKVGLGGTLDYPLSWLPTVVEPLVGMEKMRLRMSVVWK